MFREEKDSLGTVLVPADKFYGSVTQRSLDHFRIGKKKMPLEQIYAMVEVKKACALTNFRLRLLTKEEYHWITEACNQILEGKLDDHFVLTIYQTGSGTQTNMNVNEVIANYGNHLAKKQILHPNDHVNRSQSTNDVFPTAMHIATRKLIDQQVIPKLDEMIDALDDFAQKHSQVMKVGRTHLQDATNLTVGQQFSGYVSGLKAAKLMILDAAFHIDDLAIGGTAVGTGINTPDGYLKEIEKALFEVTGYPYRTHNNKFEHLSLKSGMSFLSGALKTLATTLFKIANDIRFLSSGPRLGYGELIIKANEPGSSIMPGKINPTQSESMMMVAMTVIGNDEVIGLANSQGNFELNVMMPLISDKMIESCRLLSDSMHSFTKHVIVSMKVNTEKQKENVENNLMSATRFTPYLGYEVVAELVKVAYEEGKSFKEVGLQQKVFTKEQYDEWTK